MSTLAYAILTSRREEALPGKSTKAAPPGIDTYIDTLVALVPAEVLAVHATIISFTTTKTDQITHITAPGTLRGVFFALIALAAGLYWFGHRDHWDNWDWLRICIAPLAFVGWTMLQQTTAFDAIAPGLAQAPRFAIAVIGAVVLGAAATGLSYRADQQPPRDHKPDPRPIPDPSSASPPPHLPS